MLFPAPCAQRSIAVAHVVLGAPRDVNALRRRHCWARPPSENTATCRQPDLPLRRKQPTVVRAQPDDRRNAPRTDNAAQIADSLPSLVASPLYKYWLQGAMVLLLLMLVDAAYSGDWSRIGAITKETEGLLQKVVGMVAGMHVASATAAALSLSGRGEHQWPLQAAKVLLCGPLALLEVLYSPLEQRK